MIRKDFGRKASKSVNKEALSLAKLANFCLAVILDFLLLNINSNSNLNLLNI